jgi:hypothetical protein
MKMGIMFPANIYLDPFEDLSLKTALAIIIFSFVAGNFTEQVYFTDVSNLYFEQEHPGMHQFWQRDDVSDFFKRIIYIPGSRDGTLNPLQSGSIRTRN